MTRSTSFTVRPETEQDHDAISRVVAAAFGSQAEADLVDRIRESAHYVPESALVAEVDGAVVGHVMVSGTMLRHRTGEREIAMLSPLAVHPDHQKRGIGAALVTAVVEITEERGEPLVILEGNPAYYGRFGFQHSLLYAIEIHLPDWAPPEAAQVKLLRSFDPADATLRGEVIYPAAFDGLE